MRRYHHSARHDLIPPRRTGRADLPHPALSIAVADGMRRQLCGRASQIHQTHSSQELIVRHPLRRTERPLAAAAHMLREPLTCVRVDLAKGHTRVSESKVVRPARELRIDFLDQLPQRCGASLAGGSRAQCLPPQRHGFLRWMHIEVLVCAPFEVAIVPQREPEEVQACSFLLQVDQSCLLPVDLQPHPLLQLRLDEGAQALALMARQHHEVIGVAHQLCLCPVRRPCRRMEHLVEVVQVEVCQQRRDHPALGRAACRPGGLRRPPWGGGWFDHFGFQPAAEQVEDRPVCDPHTHTGHELVVRYRVEVPLEVRVIHRLIPGLEVAAYLCQSLVGRAPRAKPVGAVQEVGFENRFEDQQGGRLHNAVADVWNPQRSQLPVGLGYVDTAYSLGAIGLGAQLLVELLHQPQRSPLAGLDRFDRDAVDSGLAPVGSHLQPSRPQHVVPIDPVVQRIKPELRLLLGLVAQLLSQLGKFLRQLGSLPRTRVSELLCQLFRSGTVVQAAHPSSDISTQWPRPLRSTVVTRFLATMSRSDSRPQPLAQLCIPARRRTHRPSSCAGSPRFLSRSVPTRCLLPPRKARWLHLPVASPPVSGFNISERLATFTLRNEAEPSSLALRLAGSPPEASPDGSLHRTLGWLSVERAIDRVTSFQITRTARLGLAHQRRRENASERVPMAEDQSPSAVMSGFHAFRSGKWLSLRLCVPALKFLLSYRD